MAALTEYTIERIYKKNRHKRYQHPLESLIVAQGVVPPLSSEDYSAFENEEQAHQYEDPLAYIDGLREFFLLNLFSGSFESWPSSLQQLFHKTLAVEQWDTYQLVAALKAANRLLALGEKPAINATTLKSGAAPFQVPSYWPAGELPHIPTHAELGVIWIFIGRYTNDQKLIDAGYKVGQWQLTFALDHTGAPLNGLLTQESEGSAPGLLLWNYLLFRLLGKVGNILSFLSAADRQSTLLHENESPISPYLVVLERWIESTTQPVLTRETPPISSMESDSDCAIIIRREEARTVLSTLAGSKSGLGAYVANGVQIVNFGPQHLPFGDCEGFGLEQSPSALFKRDITVNSGVNGGFGCHANVKLAGKGGAPTALFRRAEQSGYWIDFSMQYEKGILDLHSSFMGFHSVEGLAFVFYVKAKGCKLGGDKVIALRSLEHFRGAAAALSFEGDDTTLVIEPQYVGEMEVIPLGGGGSFWDADYLVGFPVSAHAPKLSWRVHAS